MSDTELTVSHPLWIKVDLADLDFNGLVGAISAAAAPVAHTGTWKPGSSRATYLGPGFRLLIAWESLARESGGPPTLAARPGTGTTRLPCSTQVANSALRWWESW